MPKFTAADRALVKSIVACLSIKRIPESEIVKEIYRQTHKTVSTRHLTDFKAADKERILQMVFTAKRRRL
jgi:hypothetical protein